MENKAVYVELIETQVSTINSDYQPCSHYMMKDFLQCSKASLKKILEENVSCYIFHFKEILSGNDGKLHECNTQKSVTKVPLIFLKFHLLKLVLI